MAKRFQPRQSRTTLDPVTGEFTTTTLDAAEHHWTLVRHALDHAHRELGETDLERVLTMVAAYAVRMRRHTGGDGS